MARLANFLYCLNAERQQDPQGKGESINAMGVLTVLVPEFIPGLFSFSIIFSVLDIALIVRSRLLLKIMQEMC